MIDVVNTATRSRMMSGIRGKDTKPELIIRRLLHARGFRFRLHSKGLPGQPDIVFPRRKAVAFINGCFWHRHPNCKYATNPKTRPEFWQAKFTANTERDAKNEAKLHDAGWRVAKVWECSIKKDPELVANLLSDWLHSSSPFIDLATSPDHIVRDHDKSGAP